MSMLRDTLSSVRGVLGGADASLGAVEEHPLRTELLSLEQLEAHAHKLAGWHQADLAGGPDRLLDRLADNESIITATYEHAATAVGQKRRIVPAEDWLLDNYHVINEQVRMARRHLPKSYSRQLPRLLNGPMTGYPRVYDIALELISHTDGVIDRSNLSRFVDGYQDETALTLGELWAVPIMLRLALIENLRRVCARLAWARRHQERADEWADRIIERARKNPAEVVIEVADMARVAPELSSAFVPQFMRRLQSHGTGIQQAVSWIEQQLAERGQTPDQLVNHASSTEAADQIAIGNSIHSLRSLSGMDWKRFVEKMSVVEATLRADPAGVYSEMDFVSRDRCRHVVERLARRVKIAENEVAQQAVRLAEPRPVRGPDGGSVDLPPDDTRTGHVGYYLLDDGLHRLEKAVGLKLKWRDRIRRRWRRGPLSVYLGSIGAVAVAVALIAMSWTSALGAGGAESISWWLLAALAVVGSSTFAVTLVNMFITRLTTPRSLPKLDLSDGLTAENRSIVAIPTLISGSDSIRSLVDDLEVRFLANRDDNLLFALLTDFPDTDQQTLPTDAPLLCEMREAVEALNRRYPSKTSFDTFYWLHRPRLFNEHEQVWMAWERKRGKLMQFNRLLRHGETGAFSEILGDVATLRSVRFVLPLDTDTQLPREAARELIATLAHPLNRPQVDPETKRVTRGYAILQPRVANGLDGANASRYAAMMSGEAGIDPYTREVSDVYQDLFAEGSFIGKGIYDVDAFEESLDGRFPDNLLMSHDLIESCFTRSALVSDVQLVEDYPSSFLADMSRRHRWVRGDWQQWFWLLTKAPSASGEWIDNPITALGRWKLFDNIRRTIAMGALLGAVVLGWLLTPAAAVMWTLLLVGLLVVPSLIGFVLGLASKGTDAPLVAHVRSSFGNLGRAIGRSAVDLAVMPFDTYTAVDAAALSVRQMVFKQRGLMRWRTSGEAERTARRDLVGHLRAMWINPALALALGVWVIAAHLPNTALVAAVMPVLGLWAIAPIVAWWLSQPRHGRARSMSRAQRRFMRRASRLCWRYFEVFVGPETNWLPPDNYQETDDFGLDARTSPTNLGMGLLANLTALDLGYISVGQLIDRTGKQFDAMERMEHYRGHFYNWYDTRTLAKLPPHYVSAVDSGNLAGHLLVTESGLRVLADQPIMPTGLLAGLTDTLAMAQDVGKGDGYGVCESASPAPLSVVNAIEALASRIGGEAQTLADIAALLDTVAADAGAIRRTIESDAPQLGELLWWIGAIERHAAAQRNDLQRLTPYLDTLGVGKRPALPVEVTRMLAELDAPPTLSKLARAETAWCAVIDRALEGDADAAAVKTTDPAAVEWLRKLRTQIALAADRAAERIVALHALADRADELADMDFRVVYDDDRHLLRIGLNVADHLPDPSYYDLLASEARLASYIAIANGQLPQDHWFNLGRALTVTEGHLSLVSWSGSMFEYLMPNLVMPSYDRTLLDETNRAAVKRQMQYARQRSVPWGVSESSYAAIDAGGHYQYQAFGVPGLGLKRGLSDDLVIAPYASAMAAMYVPDQAADNLRRLADDGVLGRYGFYEAIDYTRSRVPRGQNGVPTKLFMSHHGGMAFVGMAQALLGSPMHRRFLAHPVLNSARLLLHERAPRDTQPVFPHAVEARDRGEEGEGTPPDIRVFTTPNTNWPRVHLLSNGRYHVMVTNAGGGYSRWNDLALTRWREDRTIDEEGQYVYFRDVDSGKLWSMAHQPTRVQCERYEAVFSQGRAEFKRSDQQILSHMTISVSPEDDVEVRRITLTNQSKTEREIEITTYGEIVLSTPMADQAHPAFGKLFVQTELLPGRKAILATRRPREAGQTPPWMFHQMRVKGQTVGEVSFQTDRAAFIGRGRSLSRPEAMDRDVLGGASGSVLDPVFAIRRTVRIAPEAKVIIDITTGIAPTRDDVLEQVAKYADHHFADRVFDIAPAQSQLMLQHLGATEPEAQLYGRLAAAILHANPAYRSRPSILRANKQGQSGLWRYGIGGDLPIVLLTIASPQHIELASQALKAHSYWRSKGLTVDLVIVNDDFSGYRQDLQDKLTALILSGPSAGLVDKPGGVFLRRGEQLSSDDRILLQTVARITLDDQAGDIHEQAERQGRSRPPVPRLETSRGKWDESTSVVEATRRDLQFNNGYGGFTSDGREYITSLAYGQATPAPWCNVLANDRFGTIVSESGSSYTWFENAHEFRLTPWHNDPVTDRCGEALYIRDDATGQFWSPTPLPAKGHTPYATRHGFGYSIFEHEEGGIRSEMTTFVATDAPCKFFVLKLKNLTQRPRRLSVSAVFDWVLGEHRDKSAPYVVTELDPKSGALLARNCFNGDFPGRVGFCHVSEPMRTVTGDRLEFFGRNRTAADPLAMEHAHLSGRLGAGLDPCAAVMTSVDLAEGAELEVVFMLGAGSSIDEARNVLKRYGGRNGHRTAIEDVWQQWNRILGAVHVETPDKSVDILVNGWLTYQTIACRIWGRSGYYQSGGAFGFRDQLQDCMALLHAAPWIYRGHLVYSCEHQFTDGDVQHWWHPPTNRGVRTKIRDDYLWLPYAAARYVSATGDTGVLDEERPFITARQLEPHEESNYDAPNISDQVGSVYEHCVRAIENGLQFGERGLPLMGCGDWNDGMDRVGPEGKGESVWLAFFLYDTLVKFAPLADARGDLAFAQRCRTEADKLQRNIEANAWDGDWYRRAYFDDGTPLGSKQNEECQIDALPQAWAAITGAVDPQRTAEAMAAVNERLIRRDIGIIQLFDPPFDDSDLQPGYIKGYVPGVRENGGQYTHAATWVTMAFAALGDAERAWECFNIINPIRHGGTRDAIETYKVEPYVMAADVYGVNPHEGRGGWTWYTGSGGWVYRVLTETILGLRIEVDELYFEPCLPSDWGGFKMHYRYRETFYHINVIAEAGHANTVKSVTVDGDPIEDGRVHMVDDKVDHKVEIVIE